MDLCWWLHFGCNEYFNIGDGVKFFYAYSVSDMLSIPLYAFFLKSMSDLHMYLIDITLFSDSNFLKYKWFASVIDVLSIYTTSYFRICLCVYLYHVYITPFFCCTLFKQAWFMLSPLPTLLSHIMPLWSPFEVLRTNLATQQELA